MVTNTEIKVERDGHVVRIVLTRPPHNYVDPPTMQRLADVLLQLDEDDACRAVVLSSGADAFCAGANFNDGSNAGTAVDPAPFYVHAMRLFRNRKPIVAAVEGAAVGAGLGLALVADFRVTCPQARFSANFNRLGFHPGFGLSLTLPRLIGAQKAGLLFYTGRRIGGAEAVAIGLADELVDMAQVGARAMALAQQELAIQLDQFRTEDFREGVAAMAARRLPVFKGR